MPLHTGLSCLIIDPWAEDRRALRALLAAQGDCQVAGEAARWTRARRLLEYTTYSLVFLSEKLIGGDAWSLLPYVRRGARVVVMTRVPEDPLRAFEVNALDYLVKPFPAERLAKTLTRMEPAQRWGSSLRSPVPIRRRAAAERAQTFGVQTNLAVATKPAASLSDTGASPVLRLNS